MVVTRLVVVGEVADVVVGAESEVVVFDVFAEEAVVGEAASSPQPEIHIETATASTANAHLADRPVSIAMEFGRYPRRDGSIRGFGASIVDIESGFFFISDITGCPKFLTLNPSWTTPKRSSTPCST